MAKKKTEPEDQPEQPAEETEPDAADRLATLAEEQRKSQEAAEAE